MKQSFRGTKFEDESVVAEQCRNQVFRMEVHKKALVRSWRKAAQWEEG
jgi:hypothetical protein